MCESIMILSFWIIMLRTRVADLSNIDQDPNPTLKKKLDPDPREQPGPDLTST